jgi:PAS domain S-box-containing protein
MVGFITDITERKRAEEALIESEEKFSTAFNTSPNAITITRLSDGKIIEGNESSYRLFGYNPEEVIGKTTTELGIWADPNDRIKLVKEIRSKGVVENMELVLKKENGTEFPVIFSAALITISGQECFLSSFLDLTERKRAEENLKRSNAELQQFAYVASHDLQEPLRMVTSYLDLLNHKYGDRLEPKAKEYMAYAVDGADRMRELVNDLLSYSRVDSKPMKLEVVDLNTVVDEVAKDLHVSINDTKAEMFVDALPTIVADRTKIKQVFQNLLSNAVKFHDDAPAIVTISARRLGREWQFAVKDNGIGIDSKFQDKIFEMFQRLHTKEEYAGTGIGLAISKKIVEKHGGRIWVESEPGKGSTFYFTIPTYD